jgi:DNA-binding GntR family transcriptional regulator
MVMQRDAGANMTQSAYENLRADLLACRIMPGSRLKIQALCERFSVSLGAIREALSRLSSEGLVVAEPRRGFMAAAISAAELEELTQARIELDSLCLRRAIALGKVDWEVKLVAASHRLSRTPERAPNDPARSNDAWAEAHAGFHLALIEGCGNAWLVQLHSQLYMQSERYRRLSVPFADGQRDVAGEHGQILEATLARDAERAVELLTQHFQMTSKILVKSVIDVLPAAPKPAGPRRARTPARL